MRSGDLMIKAANMKSAKKFLNAKYVDVVSLAITRQSRTNFFKEIPLRIRK